MLSNPLNTLIGERNVELNFIVDDGTLTLHLLLYSSYVTRSPLSSQGAMHPGS